MTDGRTSHTYELIPARLDIERPGKVKVKIRGRDVRVIIDGKLAVAIMRSRSPIVVREYE